MTTTDLDTDTGADTRERGRVREGLHTARTRASDAYAAARERTSTAAGKVRDRASSAYDSARGGASRARQRTSDGVDTNPMAALVGGLALGALIAAVLPKSRREEELLGRYGKRINETAREAARAAREAGTTKLDELGVNRDAAKEKLSQLASTAGEAARTSASAAAKKVKGSSGTSAQQ